MLRRDLYDLAEKIIAARALPVSARQIERAKRGRRTFVVRLDAPLTVDINYDTQVVEEGILYLYADVYGRGTNTVANLRRELESSGVDHTTLDDRTLRRMMARATRAAAFVVSIESIKQGRALADGRSRPVVARPPARSTNASDRGDARR